MIVDFGTLLVDTKKVASIEVMRPTLLRVWYVGVDNFHQIAFGDRATCQEFYDKVREGLEQDSK